MGGDRRVVVNAIITHYQQNLAPSWSEHDPTVKLYLDSDCERDPIEFKLHPEDPNGFYEVRVTGVPKTRILHNMFAIGIKSYTETTTSAGIPVRTEAGQDYVLIKDVLEAHKAGTDYVKSVKLEMPSVQNYLKGEFSIRIPRKGGMWLGGAEISRPTTLISKFIGKAADPKNAARPVVEYIMKTMAAKDSVMSERSAVHARVRIPVYMGGAGLMLTHASMPLPAAAFMLYEIPKTNAAFWGNAFQVVMRRNGMLLSDWHRLRIGQKAQVMKEVVCYLPQYIPYKSDKVDTNTRFKQYNAKLVKDTEEFSSGLEKISSMPGGGAKVDAGIDCEDSTQAIEMCRDALASMQFDEHAHAGLKEIQQISKEYIAGMVLCTVTAAAVGGADDASKHLGAHMMVLMIPQHDFKQWVSRHDAQIAERLPFDERYMRENLPVLEGEGTGIYFSKKGVSIGQEARADLYREACFQKMKAPIFHEYGEKSPFYRDAMTLMLPDFARRDSNFIAFWFKSGIDNARGVPFEHLENKRDTVALVPQPEIPANVMNMMRETVKIRVPPAHLVLSQRTKKHHAEAERIVRTVASWGREPEGLKMAGEHVVPAAIYTRHNLLTSKQADRIISTLRRKSGVYKVDYVTEPIMDVESPGLRLMIYDDVRASQPMMMSRDNATRPPRGRLFKY